jgi:hypothetical protein
MLLFQTRDERSTVDVAWIVVALLVGIGIGLAVAKWSQPRATMHLLDQDGQLLIEFAEEPTPEEVERFRTVFLQLETRTSPSVLRSGSNPSLVDPLTRPRSEG